jgi:dipeptidase
MCTRRIWRVFTLANRALALSPYTDTFATFGYGPDGSLPYPFSVKPDRLLTVQDVYRMNRDQYEGTVFDLTNRSDAGPMGDPMRFPANKVCYAVLCYAMLCCAMLCCAVLCCTVLYYTVLCYAVL